MNKKIKFILVVIILFVSSYYLLLVRPKSQFIAHFVENVNHQNYKSSYGAYIQYVEIEGQKVFYTSADSCGNERDGFDLCLISLPDGTVYAESSRHYCGLETTSGVIRKLQRETLEEFIASLEETGFKKLKTRTVVSLAL